MYDPVPVREFSYAVCISIPVSAGLYFYQFSVPEMKHMQQPVWTEIIYPLIQTHYYPVFDSITAPFADLLFMTLPRGGLAAFPESLVLSVANRKT